MTERLQKVLASAGLGSRRGCEELIRSGRVTVNGVIAELGSKADPDVDDIRVDGNPIKSSEPLVYVALYKPVGVVSSRRSQSARSTVCDLVEAPAKLYPVGRLDVDSEGLILLTNDGDLTHKLTHPRFGHEKEYRVLLDRRPDAEQMAALRRGIVLEDGVRTLPARAWHEKKAGEDAWLRIVLRQGRKRQIRETARALGLKVYRLIRVRIGRLSIGKLKPGEWRFLDQAEIVQLKTAQSPKGRSGSTKGKVVTR
jgi:23S rRNA pseudouridine2605 synthase